MLAAKSAGLESCLIEGFDEDRVRKLLKIPRPMRVALIVCVGYALEGYQEPAAVQLPLEAKLSLNSFSNKARLIDKTRQ